MRTLLYVPIIHASADLGSLSKEVAYRGVARLGEEAWDRHQQTVEGFWRSVGDAFDGLNVAGMKIYQDGMVADGVIGHRIVEETARAGSPNYQLVLGLLRRGASLIKTEDLDLVKREYNMLIAMTQAVSWRAKFVAAIRYKIAKRALLKRRDAFIAERIHETLEPGETGILFIGALHDVVQWLHSDVQIHELKDRCKVRDYQRVLPIQSKHAQQCEELGRYLVAQVTL